MEAYLLIMHETEKARREPNESRKEGPSSVGGLPLATEERIR